MTASCRRMLAVTVACTVAAAFTADEALARGRGEDQVAHCIRKAAGGRGWLEKTLWGLYDQEGGWRGAQVRNGNGSYDLGPLQVNSWWVGRISGITGRSASQVRDWLTNDVCFNVDAARWIFLSGLSSTGDYWEAVGVYHSPTTWRQRRYALDVAAKLERRFGPRLFLGRTAR
jgi:hypothetical protein